MQKKTGFEWFNGESAEKVCHSHMLMLQEEKDGKKRKKKTTAVAATEEMQMKLLRMKHHQWKVHKKKMKLNSSYEKI
jgi:hypothetical protein